MAKEYDPKSYLDELVVEFPRLRIVDKSGDALSLAIDRFLRIVTFGGQSRYCASYVTTIGQRIYLPDGWDQRCASDRYITLRHEAVHLRQFRRFSLVGMSLLYILPILPLGLAYGRARLEWEAYEETLRATAEVHGIARARDPSLRARIVTQFVGPAYGWMWPFRATIESWIDDALARIAEEAVS